MRAERGRECLSAALCALLTLAAFYIFNSNALRGHTTTLHLLMQSGILAIVCLSGYVLLTRPAVDRTRLLVTMLLALGILMRIGYMLYTPATLRGHDLSSLESGSVGHAGYIRCILEGSLPQSYAYQFYHPPLFHALAAGAVWLYRALSGYEDFAVIFEAAKTVSCIASIFTLLYARKLCSLLKLSDRATLLALALAAFLPNHYLLAGRVNNDALVIFFMTAILYYTLLWYRDQKRCTLVKLALCYGLGAMSKLSALTLCPVTACVMLLVLWRRLKEQRAKALLGQYCLFAGIALPLGLWYPLRNYFRFGQPLNYVMRVADGAPGSVTAYSLWQRLGLSGFSTSVYNRVDNDYNVWNYLWRGSLFGQFRFDVGRIIPALLLLCNLLLILGSLVALVYVLVKRRSFEYVTLGCAGAILLLSYLVFNIRFPFSFTMDFRYVVPTALIGALFLARGLEELPDTGAGKLLRRGSEVTTAAFSILSMVMFCNVT